LEVHYKDGREDGLFTLFYDNGTKRSESNFVRGEKVGYETYWERNGDVKSKTLYKDNKPVN
jgi:antitoxin component YwqK of YwqJK toxin-antitoxin module